MMFYDCPGLSVAVQSTNACDAATGSAPSSTSTTTSNANNDMIKPSKAASSKRCGSKNLNKKPTGRPRPKGVKCAKLTKVKKINSMKQWPS